MRIALVWPSAETSFPIIVTDATAEELEVFSVAETAPNDRVYHMTTGVRRVDKNEMDVLLGTTIGTLGDRPGVEQAVRAVLARCANGQPNLTVIEGEG